MAASQTEFENNLTIFSLISAGVAKDMVDLDSRKPPRRNLQNQPAPGKGALKFCISNRGEVGEVKILTIKRNQAKKRQLIAAENRQRKGEGYMKHIQIINAIKMAF